MERGFRSRLCRLLFGGERFPSWGLGLLLLSFNLLAADSTLEARPSRGRCAGDEACPESRGPLFC